MTTQQERLASLIKFTQQTLLMNKKPTTNINQHKEFVRIEEQLTGLPGVSFNIDTGTENETWLYVERLHESAPPQPNDKLLKIWINFPNKFTEIPTLKDKVLNSILVDAGIRLPLDSDKAHISDIKLSTNQIDADKENSSETIDTDKSFTYLKDFLEKEKLDIEFKDYITTSWEPWLRQENLIRRSIKLYSDLFLLSKELQGNLADARLELVWGVGIALWNRPDDTNIKYPILTHQVEILLDKDTMALSVKPSPSTVKLETEPFSSSENPRLVELIDTSKDFFDADDLIFNPFNASTYSPVLNAAASLLDPTGSYQSSQSKERLYIDRKLPKATDSLVITDTWVLMARPRGDNFVLQDLENFITKLKGNDAQVIPNALSAILCEPSAENQDIELPSYRGISAIIGGDSQSKPKDLYFPKPYNDEQVRIIQMLESYDGLVVQGPPGTGKTHTIANVVCHYLALGKRVLVTSMKDPALSVLKEKLPESIQPLAISLLSSDNESIKQFESSIRKISSEVSSIDRRQYQVAIEQLDNTIDTTHAHLAQTDADISHWGRVNLEYINIDSEIISPLDAAKLVASKQNDISWFPDKLGLDQSFKPQFSNTDIIQLRDARLSIKDDLNYLNETLPNVSELPTVSQITKLHQSLLAVDELNQAEMDGALPTLINDSDSTIETIKQSLVKTAMLRQQLNEIIDSNTDWSDSFKQHLYSQNKIEIIEYFHTLKSEINNALASRTVFITKPITLL